MMKRQLTAAACFIGSLLLVFAFSAESEWYSAFAARYGSFPTSPGEMALRYHLLALILPASALLALAGAIAAAPRALGHFDALGTRGTWLPAVIAAAFTAMAVTAVRVFILKETALTDDENVFGFQAQLIGSARMWVQSAPPHIRAFFDNQFIVNDGRRYAPYFIGHSVVLALATRLGVERWLGAVEAVIVLLVAVDVARRVFGSRTAVLTAVLLAASPFFLALFATRLSEPTSAVFIAVAIWSAARIEEQPQRTCWWVLAAAALSAGMLTRPQTTAWLGVAIFARPLLQAWARRREGGARALVSFCAVLALGAAAFGWANAARTGSPWRTGYAAYMAQGITWSMPIGLGPSLRQISEALGHLNVWLFGWPLSLAFVPLYQRRPLATRLALGSLLLVLGYGAIGIPTVAPVGPVYYGELIAPLGILCASGIERAVEWIRRRPDAPNCTAAWVALWPAAATALGFLTFVPAQAVSLERMGTLNASVYELASRSRLEDAVVFVAEMPGLRTLPGTWAYFHRNADPDLSDPVLFVRELGPERDRQLLAFLPGRRGFRLQSENGVPALVPFQ